MCLTMSILGVGKIIDDSIRLDRLDFIDSERVALNTNKTEAGLTKDKRRKKVDFYSNRRFILSNTISWDYEDDSDKYYNTDSYNAYARSEKKIFC